VELMLCHELSSFSFFQRGPIKEHIRFRSRLLCKVSRGAKPVAVNLEDVGQAHCFVHPSGLGAVAIVDAEYPNRVAMSLLKQSIDKFIAEAPGGWETANADMAIKCPSVEAMFQEYQNPVEADKLTKIERDLEDVKQTVLDSMDDLLKRGEKLEDLMDKSKDLSSTSVQFYRTAKKNNQCCALY